MEVLGKNIKLNWVIASVSIIAVGLIVYCAIGRVSMSSRDALNIDGGELVNLEKQAYAADQKSIVRLILYYKASATHLENTERLHRAAYWEERLNRLEREP